MQLLKNRVENFKTVWTYLTSQETALKFMNEPIVELHAHVDIFFSNYYNLQSVYFELVRLQKKKLENLLFS